MIARKRKIAKEKARMKTLVTEYLRTRVSQQEYNREKVGILQNIQNLARSGTFSIILLGIVIVALVKVITLTNKLTGYAVTDIQSSAGLNILFYLIFSAGAITLLILTNKKRIKEGVERIKRKYKKYPKNSIKGLINKSVYTDSGKYIGEVKEVIFHKNKIGQLKIRLGKKYKSKKKGIIIKYKNVKEVGEILIINHLVLSKIIDKK